MDIQDPEKFSEKDYQKFEYLLFAEDTPLEKREEIVMTLAHLPTKRAQELLKRFKESEMAEEIEWLEPAIEEGKMWTIWPENEQEERDMMALKLYHEKNESIVELMGKCQKYEYRISQYEIERQALETLQKSELPQNRKEELRYRLMAIQDMIRMEQNKLEQCRQDIEIEEQIAQTIKKSIQTERYKNLDPRDIAGFHFDGEE